MKNLVRFVPPFVSTKLHLDLVQLSKIVCFPQKMSAGTLNFLGKSCHVKKVTPCKICGHVNTYFRKYKLSAQAMTFLFFLRLNKILEIGLVVKNSIEKSRSKKKFTHKIF